MTKTSDFAFPAQPTAVLDLTFADGTGTHHAFSEFPGRPIILNIWATWCAPCRREMPTLDRLQRLLAGTNVLVIPLSIDSKGPSAVKAFYSAIGIKSLGIYVDPVNAASQKLKVFGIPTTLLIDGRGERLRARRAPSPGIVRPSWR